MLVPLTKILINVVNPHINTTGFTGTPHKGVDRADGLVYKQSWLGWETCPLCSKLHNTKPMGFKRDNRVQTRACPAPIPAEDQPGDPVLTRGA